VYSSADQVTLAYVDSARPLKTILAARETVLRRTQFPFMYAAPKNAWPELKAAPGIKRVTSIDIGVRTYTAATIEVATQTLIHLAQYDLVSLFGLKNGKDRSTQMQWVTGLCRLFKDSPEAFGGDLIVVEKQLQKHAMGRHMSKLADITLTYWKAMGREIALGCSRGTHKFMEQEDMKVTHGMVSDDAETAYDANKARASDWLRYTLSPQHMEMVEKIATKKKKIDDLADAIRQGLWAIFKLSGKRPKKQTKAKKPAKSPKAKQPARAPKRTRKATPATKDKKPRTR